jgi:hypothetical protein
MPWTLRGVHVAEDVIDRAGAGTSGRRAVRARFSWTRIQVHRNREALLRIPYPVLRMGARSRTRRAVNRTLWGPGWLTWRDLSKNVAERGNAVWKRGHNAARTFQSRGRTSVHIDLDIGRVPSGRSGKKATVEASFRQWPSCFIGMYPGAWDDCSGHVGSALEWLPFESRGGRTHAMRPCRSHIDSPDLISTRSKLRTISSLLSCTGTGLLQRGVAARRRKGTSVLKRE